MRGVTVSARWLDFARPSGAELEVHHTERTYQPDDAGRFRFCGVVREHAVVVKVVGPGGIAIADTSLVAYDPVVRWTWRVKPKR